MMTPFKQVMIIDDSDTDLFITSRLLTIARFASAVMTRNSVRSALDYFSEQLQESGPLPDLLFLDLNMPEYNGFDFLESFHLLPDRVRQTCKIIILSSSDNAMDIHRVSLYPYVVRFVTKPLSARLLAEISETLTSGFAGQ